MGDANRATRVDEATKCLLWLGPVDSDGRPVTHIDGRVLQARRQLYQQFHGALPAKLNLRSLCGRLTCVSPNHAAIKAPRSAMRKAHATPQQIRAIKEAMKACSEREQDYQLDWDCRSLAGLSCLPSEINRWATNFKVPYIVALAAYCELARASLTSIKRENIPDGQRLR